MYAHIGGRHTRDSPVTSLYILNAYREPVPCADLIEWGIWFETADRHVAATEIVTAWDVTIRVSTVFLGFDHGFAGPPVLFETMIFGGPEGLNEYQCRYCTWSEAEAGHARAVAAVKAVIAARERLEQKK